MRPAGIFLLAAVVMLKRSFRSPLWTLVGSGVAICKFSRVSVKPAQLALAKLTKVLLLDSVLLMWH